MDMSKAIDSAFYKSTAWKRCRLAYIKMRGGLCERCLAQGVFTPGYIVHHKTYLTEENLSNPEIALDFNNLELLCATHHNLEHKAKKRRYEIDDNGNVLIDLTSPYT